MDRLSPLRAVLLVSTLAATGCPNEIIDFPGPRAAGGTYAGTGGGTSGTGGAPASGTGGAGGSSAGCVPGNTTACYSGPAGTAGVGLCKAGVKTCNADGMTYGPCAGEVTPKPEDCATPFDEDCDGMAPPCKGNLLWGKRFGDAANQAAEAVAVDAAGNVIVAGSVGGVVDFGCGMLPDSGVGLFVAKFTPAGSCVWSQRHRDNGGELGDWGVAVDGSGGIAVTGHFSGAMDLGGGPLDSAGADDVFVARLDAGGHHLWSKRFGDAEYQLATGVAVDAGGNTLLTGRFAGSIDFGGGTLQAAGGDDVFVAKLDAGGNHVWSRRFGDAGNQGGQAIAADAAGNVLIAGYFFGAVDFGGAALQSAGADDVFVAKLDPAGDHLWSRRFGDAAIQEARSLAIDPSGSVLITGYLGGTADFGGGPRASAGAGDVFVAKLDAAGNHQWSKRFGDAAMQGGTSVAVDGGGNVLLAGEFFGTVDLGGGPLQSAGSSDVFLAKLDGSGAHQWSKRFGGASHEGCGGLAMDGAGNAILAGWFGSTIDFGGGPLPSVGDWDMFVAKFTY